MTEDNSKAMLSTLVNTDDADMDAFLSFLSVDSKVILCLVYACREPIPEDVLGLLYAAANPSKGFSKSIYNLTTICGGRLEARTTSPLACWTDSNAPGLPDGNLTDSTAWSLSFDFRLYLDKNMAGREDIRSLIETLLGGLEPGPERTVNDNGDSETEVMESEKRRLVIALCALYFDQTHSDEVVREAATRAATLCSLKDSKDGRNVRRRTAIEPMIWLLHQSVRNDGRLTEINFRCVREILLKYVYEHQLDDANISILLKFDRYASMAALRAIDRIYLEREQPLLDKHHFRFLEVFVDLLKSDENVHISIQHAAGDALRSIFRFFRDVGNEQSIADVSNYTPGLLAALVSLIKDSIASTTQRSHLQFANAAVAALCDLSRAREGSKHENPFLQEMAARTSLSLSQTISYKDRQILNEFEGLPGSSLSEDSYPYLHEKETTASALRKQAYRGESSRLKLLREGRVITSLVRSFSDDSNPNLQEAAAWTLVNIADSIQNGYSESVRLRLLKEYGILAALVKSLLKDNNPPLQECAARELNNLSAQGAEILKEPMALANLVRSLHKDDHPNLQEQVALVLWTLSSESGDELAKLQIVQEDGALAGLVRSLSKDDCLCLQKAAAATLRNLADGQELVQLELLKAGAVAGLLKSLLKENNPVLQEYAAQALIKLSGGESFKIEILKEPMALANLVRSLSKDDHPILQKQVADILWSLSSGEKSTRLQILQEPGALAGLVRSLSKDDCGGLQEAAAGTLSNLAFRQESTQSEILETVALAGLVKSLLKDNNPPLQENAAKALCNVTYRRESINIKIVKESGILPALMKSLLKDNNPLLQECAARVLNNLSAQGGERIGSEILKEPMALANLVRSLSKDDFPNLQDQVAEVLRSLSSGEKSTRLQILREPGALAGLVRSLSKDDCLGLQEAAAGTLSNLAFRQESTQREILETVALAGLVKSLLKDNNPPLQENAAKALCNVTYRRESINIKIMKESGILPALLKSLLKDDNPLLQECAARVLNNLSAQGGERIGSEILKEPRALANVVRSLSKDDHPNLQEQVAEVLRSLSSGEKSAKLQIVREPGALAGLVRSLSNDDYPSLQKTAAETLLKLAHGGKLKCALLKEEGALVGCVRLLSKNDNPGLQSSAIAFLINLANGEESMKIKIINQDGALAGLVSCLLQENPAVSDLDCGMEPVTNLRSSAAVLLEVLSRVEDCSMKQKIENQDRLFTALAMSASEQDNAALHKNAEALLNNLASIP